MSRKGALTQIQATKLKIKVIMKPKIKKQNKKWILTYHFPPRAFWLFGANAEERKTRKEKCYSEVCFQTQQEAIRYLKLLYEQKMIVT
jgi:hypothetical protein